ncbi:hypothetical protein L1049_004118 [Liquidambar formosana]|uniref:Uncharacterized protein n=1 Tax=Liquidambar formosana TaxID=63359 RepID=A0AAP0RNJ5_LIQFO
MPSNAEVTNAQRDARNTILSQTASLEENLSQTFSQVRYLDINQCIDGILQIVGAFWYLFAVERYDTCWQQACIGSRKCNIMYLYCGNRHMEGYYGWRDISESVLANALRGVQRLRNMPSPRGVVKLQKPPEPDFTADDAD